jgi:hypothetical protein
MLTKIANTAMTDGLKVLQIFFEDNRKLKTFSCWSKISLNELSTHREDIMDIVTEMTAKKGVLKLKKFSSDGTTIPVIRQYIRKLTAQGF